MLAIVFAAGLALAGAVCLVWGIRRMARSQPDGGTQNGQSGLGGGAFGVQVNVNGPWPLVVSGFGVVMLIAAAVLVIIRPGSSPAASSASSSPVSPSITAASRSPHAGTPTPLVACGNLVGALRKEASAIRLVNSNVMGSSTKPTRIEPGYNQAKKHERATNKVAMDALDAYTLAGLKVPIDEDVSTILDDVNSYIARLPAEIRTSNVTNAEADWGAMQDRPNVLDQQVAPAISSQCKGL